MGDDKLTEYILHRIETIDQKVDKLLAFKWQIIGGSVLLSVLMNLGFNVIQTFINK